MYVRSVAGVSVLPHIKWRESERDRLIRVVSLKLQPDYDYKHTRRDRFDFQNFEINNINKKNGCPRVILFVINVQQVSRTFCESLIKYIFVYCFNCLTIELFASVAFWQSPNSILIGKKIPNREQSVIPFDFFLFLLLAFIRILCTYENCWF